MLNLMMTLFHKRRWFIAFGLAFCILSLLTVECYATPIGQPLTIDASSGNYINLRLDQQGFVHMVYSAAGIYYSNNRSGDFVAPILIGPGRKPSLAVANDGTVHIAWYKAIDSFSSELWYATNANTTDFTSSQLGTYDTLGLDGVSIAVSGDDTVHIAFNAKANGYFFGAIQYINNASGAFSSPVVVSEGFAKGTTSLEMIVDGNGSVHIAFGGSQQTWDDIIGYTTNVDGSFSSPITTTYPSPYEVDGVSLGVTTQGTIHIAFYSALELYYTAGNVSTGLATAVQIDEGTSPCLQVDAQDVVHLFYASYRSLAAEAGPMYTHNREGPFTMPTRLYPVTHDEESYSQRWCAVDGNYIHLGFSMGPTQYLLKDITLVDESFHTIVAITNDGDTRTDTQPQIAVDANQSTHIAYLSFYPQAGAPSNVASDVMVTHNTSGTFTAPITISVTGGYYSKEPALAVDGSAAEHVVFMRTANQLDASGTIYYTHNRSGAFIPPIQIATASSNPQILAHNDGHVRIVYVKDYTYYYTDNLSGTFTAPIALGTASSFGYYSIALDRNEKFHIVWLGADNNVYYTHDMSGVLAAATQISSINSLTDVFSTLSLAIDSQDNAHIAFRNSDNDADLGYINNIGGSFDTALSFNGSSGNSFSPAIAIDGLNHIHLVYIGKDNYGYNQLEYMANRGNGFSVPEVVAYGNVYGADRYFAVDSKYQGHVVCLAPINSANADIFYLWGFLGDFYPITGYVRNADGSGIHDAVVTFVGAQGPVITATTDSQGYFQQGGYADVFAKGTYTVSVSYPHDTFMPSQHILTIAPAQSVIFTRTPPHADFTATPRSGDAPLTVQFTSTVTGTVTAYGWSFGDGGIADTPNPTYTYQSAGSFGVTLVVTGPGGIANVSKPDYITVNEPPPPAPQVDFVGNPRSGNVPLTVQFTSTVTGTVTAYGWRFGDGGIADTPNPTYTYQNAGSFGVTLVVTGPGGIANVSKPDYITVNAPPPAPQVDFVGNPRSGNVPLTMQFTSTVTGTVTAYGWRFGDGGIADTPNPTYTYQSVGSFGVTLVVTGPGGIANVSKPDYITVNAPPGAPTATFSADVVSSTAPLTVTFTAVTSGTVEHWLWSFGDGGTVFTGPVVSHTYVTSGTFDVSLTVSNTHGSFIVSEPNYMTIKTKSEEPHFIYLPLVLRNTP